MKIETLSLEKVLLDESKYGEIWIQLIFNSNEIAVALDVLTKDTSELIYSAILTPYQCLHSLQLAYNLIKLPLRKILSFESLLEKFKCCQ